MQKIRCPRCGVVNLEKFLTYPQCAGCGSTLPAAQVVPAPFWRRPLGALLWVPLIGGAIVCLLLVASFLTTPGESDAQLLVYGNASRRVLVGQTVIVTMTLDAISETRAQQNASLQNVRLRLPRASFKDFAFVALEPRPDQLENTQGGRYFLYDSLPRESILRLRLLARTAGRHPIRADFYADDHAPGDFSFFISATPQPRFKTPRGNFSQSPN